MPQARWVVPRVLAELKIGGAVQAVVGELEPDRLIDADAITAHDAPQKRPALIHPACPPGRGV